MIISGGIRPGVVSLPHGWGHGRPGTRMSVANGSPGVNTDALSLPTFVDEPLENGARNGIPVTTSASSSQPVPCRAATRDDISAKESH